MYDDDDDEYGFDDLPEPNSPPEAHLDSEEPIHCAQCGKEIGDEWAYYTHPRHYCIACGGDIVEAHEKKAKAYARKHCAITGVLHRFDWEHEYRCSPDDYHAGSKESYTENSVRARNRHVATNYRKLIAGLDKSEPLDQIMWGAIRRRIEKFLDEAPDDLYDDHEQDDG